MAINVDIQDSKIKSAWLKDKKFLKALRLAHDNLHSLDRSQGTGWVELPNLTTEIEIENIKTIAQDIKNRCDVFVVVGIGGSYAGTKAALEMLEVNGTPEIIFMGTTFSAKDITSVMEKIKDKEVCVCAISKSGGTSETLVSFSFLENYLKKKYKKNKEYANRIFIITDYEKGYLRELSVKEGYTSLVIPRTVGGRYSVLSAVGLLPLAVGGINIEKLLEGAKTAYKNYFVMNLSDNNAYLYGAARNILYSKGGKQIEVLASFDDRLSAFNEWFKQLFAESEGKDKKGLFVSSLTYSTDLHSFGQFLQEGSPIIFETMITINKPSCDIKIENLDLNSPIAMMDGKLLSEVVKATETGVLAAHKKANLPIIKIQIDELNEFTIGELFYFFEISCAVSAYLTGVNPFNQPGVESYKKETKEILSIKTENK